MTKTTGVDPAVEGGDETVQTLAIVLPEGIIPGTGVALAHDDSPVWDIVGNTVRVGNIMLVRLDPDTTTKSDFQTLARRVEAILEELASVSS